MSEPEPTQEQLEAAGGWCQRFGWMASLENFPRQKRYLAELLASREAAARAEALKLYHAPTGATVDLEEMLRHARAEGIRAVLKYAQHLPDTLAGSGCEAPKFSVNSRCTCGLDVLRREAGE